MVHPSFSKAPKSYLGHIPSFIKEANYVKSFGLQWMSFSKTQLDSYTGIGITRERVLRMFGKIFDQLDNKAVLEVGCGAGRFTEVLLKQNLWLTAIDLSIAVLANERNNGNNKNLRIVQASALDLPFAPEQFDVVFCPGVVQHTPSPSETIDHLFRQVKPGGWLIFDQYRFNLASFLRTTWVFRLILKRLDIERSLKITDFLVKVMLPLHKFCAKNRILEIILFRFSPITSHFRGYPTLTSEDQKLWARLNTHDNLTDYYKRHTTIRALTTKLFKLGAINQELTLMPYTIEVRCQKPKLNQIQENTEPVIIDLRQSGIPSG